MPPFCGKTLFTGCAIAAALYVNCDWDCQRQREKFVSLHYRIDSPQPVAKKIVTHDYVGSPYSYAKFGANPSTAASVEMYEIWRGLFLGQTARPTLISDDWDDAESHKGVLLWGLEKLKLHCLKNVPPLQLAIIFTYTARLRQFLAQMLPRN